MPDLPEERECSQCGEDLEDETKHCAETGECVALCWCEEHGEQDEDD